MEEYVIKAGLTTYQFDSKERAMEIVRMLMESETPFFTNFKIDEEENV